MTAPRASQRGYLIFALTVALSAGAMIAAIAAANASSRTALWQQRETMRDLRDAKLALVAQSLIKNGSSQGQRSTPGSLACPDTTNTGVAGTCDITNPVTIGCLPWKTLGLDLRVDRDGQSIWYELSSVFANSTKTENRTPGNEAVDNVYAPINLGNAGSIVAYDTVSGTQSQAIALLISAGPPAGTQSRAGVIACNPATAAQYLDRDTLPNGLAVSNANSSGNKLIRSANPDFNDLVLALDRRDLYAPLMRVVLNQFASFTTDSSGTPVGGLSYYLKQSDITASAMQGTIIPANSQQPRFVLDRLSSVPQPCFDLQFPLPSASAGSYYRLAKYIDAKNGLFCPAFIDDANAPDDSLSSGTCQAAPPTLPIESSTYFSRPTASWMCFNNWYSYIEYSITSSPSTARLRLVLDRERTNDYECTLDIDPNNLTKKDVVCGYPSLSN